VLQRNAECNVYEAVFKRSEEAAAAGDYLCSSNVRNVAEAFPAQAYDGPGRKVLLMTGTFGGVLFGPVQGLVLAAGFLLFRQITRQT
jgi:uncharacterized protein involved in exopolysaccharide biosynthesis